MSPFQPTATRWRRGVLAVLSAAALTLVMTWPLGAHPASMGRIDTGDGRFSIWNVAWVAHALVTRGTPLFDANIFHPHTGTLAYSEANLVAGVLAVPAYALTRDGLLAHNSAVFLAFLLALAATYALARRLGASTLASAIAAAGFAFSPVVMARSAHIQLLMTVALPAAMLAFHAHERRPGLARSVLLGAALAFAALCCGYYGVFAGLMVGFASLVYGVARPRGNRGAYWVGLLFALVVAATLVWPVFQFYRGLQQGGFKAAADLAEARLYSADWRAYLASPAHAHAWILRLLGHWNEVLFPGFVLTLLGVAGGASAGRRKPRVAICYGGMAAIALWASFGPTAYLYSALARTVPIMSFLRAPARFGVVVVFALAVLAAFAVDAWSARPRWRRVAWPIAALLLADIAVVPWPLRRVAPIPPAYAMLADLPPGAVVEYPFPYHPSDFHNHTVAMFNSIVHWHPLVNGYSDYVPPDFAPIAVPINAFPDPASFQLLRARGVRYVIWRIREYTDDGRAEITRRLSAYPQELRPISTSRDVWLYEIVRWPDGSVVSSQP